MSYQSNAYLFYGVIYYMKDIDEDKLMRFVYGSDHNEKYTYLPDLSEALLDLGLDANYFSDSEYIGIYLPESFNCNCLSNGLPKEPIGKDSIFASVLPEMGLKPEQASWHLVGYRE